jgi:HK97 family phage major capsid protein
MASNVNDIISSGDLGGGLIPVEYATQIIQDAPKSSVLLTRARQIPMSTRTRTQPVLDSKPIAYWVGGDTGLKQTTKQAWKGLTITAEELAAIVPIPEAVIDDAAIPIWPEVMPRLAAAIGYKVDQAGLFGVDKPASFPTAVIPGAITAGNTVAESTAKDLAKNVAELGELLAKQGYAANGFASSPGFNWRLVGLRNANGSPIYTPSLAAGVPAALYGYGLNEVVNGAWDPTVASLLAADWSNFVVGIRQDITYKLLDQAVITDDDGKVILNLAQQDSVAMRVTFRVGFQIANPINDVQADATKRYPAAVLTPAA